MILCHRAVTNEQGEHIFLCFPATFEACRLTVPLQPNHSVVNHKSNCVQNIIYMKARATHPLGYEQKGQENVALGKRTVVIFIEVLHRTSVTLYTCMYP